MGIEWSGQQQLLFFVRSVVVGLMIGVLFDVFTGWGRIKRSKTKTFLLDVAFCLISSVITFFAALIIMNGQLHPLLLFGIALGVVVVHISVGQIISSVVVWLGRFFGKVSSHFERLREALLGVFCLVKESVEKKCRENHKKKEKNKESG